MRDRNNESIRSFTFDGDTGSANTVHSDEAIEEIYGLFKKKINYVDPKGKLIASAMNDTAEMVCFNLTR